MSKNITLWSKGRFFARGVGALALAFCTGTVEAGSFSSNEAGTRGPAILLVESGARPLGMAGAYVAVADDVASLQWNPAGLQSLSRSEFQFSHARVFAEQTQHVVGVARPTWRAKDRETWGISLNLLSMETFEVLEEGQPAGNARPQDVVTGFSYSRSLGSGSWGSTGKWIHVQSYQQSGDAFAVDFGYRSGGGGPWSWGATLTDLGTSLRMGETSQDLPTSVRLGSARKWGWKNGDRFIASAQLDFPIGDSLGGRMGMEYQKRLPGEWRASARFGARTNEWSAFSLGFGLAGRSLVFNYSFSPHTEWGAEQRADVTLRFGNEPAQETRRRDLIEKTGALLANNQILEARPLLAELKELSPANKEVRRLERQSQERFAENLDPETLYQFGRQFRAEKSWSKAAEMFRKVLLVDPSHAGARTELAAVEQQMEKQQIEQMKKELDMGRLKSTQHSIRNAKQRESAGDWAGALNHYRKALLLGGPSDEVRTRMDFCRDRLCDKAEEAWSKGNAEKALSLLKEAESAGPFPRAARRADTIRREAANRAGAAGREKYALGLKAYAAGNLESAKVYFEAALELNPSDNKTRQALDQVLRELGLTREGR